MPERTQSMHYTYQKQLVVFLSANAASHPASCSAVWAWGSCAWFPLPAGGFRHLENRGKQLLSRSLSINTSQSQRAEHNNSVHSFRLGRVALWNIINVAPRRGSLWDIQWLGFFAEHPCSTAPQAGPSYWWWWWWWWCKQVNVLAAVRWTEGLMGYWCHN